MASYDISSWALYHFKSDLDCVKGKVGLFNLYILSSYLANAQASTPEMPWLWGVVGYFEIKLISTQVVVEV